jgi:hypothetical protein
MIAFFNIAKNLPVPRKWKSLIKYSAANGHCKATLNYENFYNKLHDCPFSVTTQISLRAVRKTIASLNWSVLRNSYEGSFSFMRYKTKRETLIENSFWSAASVIGIFYLQRMLVSVRNQHICRISMNKKFDYIFLMNPAPLGMYLKAPFTYSFAEI